MRVTVAGATYAEMHVFEEGNSRRGVLLVELPGKDTLTAALYQAPTPVYDDRVLPLVAEHMQVGEAIEEEDQGSVLFVESRIDTPDGRVLVRYDVGEGWEEVDTPRSEPNLYRRPSGESLQVGVGFAPEITELTDPETLSKHFHDQFTQGEAADLVEEMNEVEVVGAMWAELVRLKGNETQHPTWFLTAIHPSGAAAQLQYSAPPGVFDPERAQAQLLSLSFREK